MGLAEEGAIVKLLSAGRDIQSRILIKEVNRLQADLDDFTRHDREVLNTWHLREG